MNYFMSLHPVLSLAVFLAGMVVLGIGVYSLGRKLPIGEVNNNSQRMGIWMFRSTGALLGFMLAVNYADVRSEFASIHTSMESEVAQLRDLRVDLDRYGGPDAAAAVDVLLEYTKSVAESEWDDLRYGRDSVKTWTLFYKLEDKLLALEPDTPLREKLQKRMLVDIDEITDHREARIYAKNLVMPMFQTVVMVIFILSIFYLSVYPKRTSRMIFVGIYSLTIGLVMYSIISMTQPFAGMAHISSQPFLDLHQEFVTYYR